MAIVNQFSPRYGSNLVVTPAASSANSAINRQDTAVRLVNTGANVCYVRVGEAAQTATTADTPVRAGSELIIRKADGHANIAYISAAGTTLNIQTGEAGL
jgi:hypothetical protein